MVASLRILDLEWMPPRNHVPGHYLELLKVTSTSDAVAEVTFTSHRRYLVRSHFVMAF